MTTELALLTRVSCRGREISGPRLRGLLALLAGDLRTGCGTARLVEGLWPEGERPENPTKALQILVSRARARLGALTLGVTVHTFLSPAVLWWSALFAGLLTSAGTLALRPRVGRRTEHDLAA